MAETTGKTIKVVVVTPERAVLDEPADMVILPLFDGEFGVMANHSPFVGQLGPGELRIKRGDGSLSYFIDGGFAQVNQNTVNVLTQFARKKDDLTDALIGSEKAKAEALPATNDVEKATKSRMASRAAAMARVAKK